MSVIIVDNKKNNSKPSSRSSEGRGRVKVIVDDPESGRLEQEHVAPQKRSSFCPTRPLSPFLRIVIRIIAGIISAAFGVYFAVVLYHGLHPQIPGIDSDDDDPLTVDEILWTAFVGLNVTMSVFFLVYLAQPGYCCSISVVSFLAMVVNVWSIVYIVLEWRDKQPVQVYHQFKKAARVSMVSAVFHQLMVWCVWYFEERF